MDDNMTCLLCGSKAKIKKFGPLERLILYSCEICKNFGASSQAIHDKLFKNDVSKAKIRHWLYKQYQKIAQSEVEKTYPIFVVDEETYHEYPKVNLKAICEQPLPNVVEQLENLIEYTGKQSPRLSYYESMPEQAWVSVAGCISKDDVRELFYALENMGLIKPNQQNELSGYWVAWLTFNGWQRYDEIKRKPSKSNLAFMAMPFGYEPETIQKEMNEAFESYWRPAVLKAGFTDLRRVDQHPEPGGIDDIIRVKIRQSTFVIADLTGHNANVYFEAGFAEACERPVIYMRHKNEPSYGKFDIQGHYTITYDPSDIDSDSKESMKNAQKLLLNTILNRFPNQIIA